VETQLKQYITCSALSRVETCPASAVLQPIRVENPAATVPSAGHYLLCRRAESHSYDVSVSEIDDVAIRYELSPIETAVLAARIRGFRWVPPEGAEPEVAFAIDHNMNVVKVPAKDAKPGNYNVPEGYWLAGTADLTWRDATVRWLADYKYGNDAWVSSIETNPQAWSLAYMASKYYGDESFIPAIIYLWKGIPLGIWETPAGAPFSLLSDRAIAFVDRLARLRDTIDKVRGEAEAGRDVVRWVTAGYHCVYCPAIISCPYYLSFVRSMAFEPKIQKGAKDREPLTAEEASLLARHLSALEKAGRTVRELLKGYCQHNGRIQISDTLAWGPHPGDTTESIVSSRQTWEIVNKHLGENAVWESIKFRKGELFEGAKVRALIGNVPSTHISRPLMQELKEAGCVQFEVPIEHGLYRTDVEPEE